MKKYSNQKGFSILELMIAILVIAMGMVSVLSLMVQNIQAQYINKNVLVAAQLTQECFELVRNVRDQNYLILGNSWYQDVVNDDGTYTIDLNGRSGINSSVNTIADSGARLYSDSNGFYTHTVTANPTIFSRLVTIRNYLGYTDFLDVECKVRWQERNNNHDYAAETYLYNWR